MGQYLQRGLGGVIFKGGDITLHLYNDESDVKERKSFSSHEREEIIAHMCFG